MVGRSAFDWAGRVRELRAATWAKPPDTPVLLAELQRSSAGSSPILFAADDGEKYWVKLPDNPQGTQTIVAETIVAEIAPLLHAPVREARRVLVPSSFRGTPYGPDALYRIKEGLAHGSLLVEHATEREGELSHAKRDDNARRIPRLIVFWDWALGQDEQWLYDDDESSTIWSFDHGLWLDAAEAPWTLQGLLAVADIPGGTPEVIPHGLDSAAFFETADALERITEEQLALALSRVPPTWEADDGLLGALGEMLFKRRPGAADRARALGSRTSKGGQRP